MAQFRSNRKILVGSVISDKMDKTVVVSVERLVRHPIYKKIFKRKSKYYAHDENNQCHIGDLVEIMETKPLSKLKRWRVVRITKPAKLSLTAIHKAFPKGLPEELEAELIEPKKNLQIDGDIQQSKEGYHKFEETVKENYAKEEDLSGNDDPIPSEN